MRRCYVLLRRSSSSLSSSVIYSIKEKELRGNLKSSVQRALNKEDVIILDSLNYIKGCRYELYCVTKSCQTPQCIIYCGTTVELATKWNRGRKEGDIYSEDIFNELVMRFEPPDSRNRWDRPLFVLQSEDELPCQQIYEALFHSKAPPPNLSTLSQPISSTNFLHELDQITQRTVNLIMEAQKTCMPGDALAVPGAKDKVELGRPLTLAELQRMRLKEELDDQPTTEELDDQPIREELCSVIDYSVWQSTCLKKTNVTGQDVGEVPIVGMDDYIVELVELLTITSNMSFDVDINKRLGKTADVMPRHAKTVRENSMFTENTVFEYTRPVPQVPSSVVAQPTRSTSAAMTASTPIPRVHTWRHLARSAHRCSRTFRHHQYAVSGPR
ncbi:hypothetical protein LSAT2_016756 [Lamellibrachia satsuma]|nr:hypothetical protein LSAT2_016756 [Lamellibrachia satsuma]